MSERKGDKKPCVEWEGCLFLNASFYTERGADGGGGTETEGSVRSVR